MRTIFSTTRMSSIAIIFVSALSFMACSEMKKVDEMKDSTSEMNTTTKDLRDKTGEMKSGLDKMSGTTGTMAQTTEEMKETTANLYEGMRQGDTATLRRELLKQIQMDSTLQGRVGDAGLYLMAFEFQVLGNSGRDKDQAHRNVLYQQAMLEFFLKLDEVAPKHFAVSPEAAPTGRLGDAANKASAFNAIAFALHKTNRQQLADPAYGKPMSFYDLIIEALRMKPLIDSGEIVLPEGPHFVKEVLARPDRVRQLLQARYNMFTFGLLGLTTNLCDSSKVVQIAKILMGVDIDLSEKSLGTARLQYIYDEIMKPAAKTTEDMISLDIQPQFTTMANFVLKGMKINFRSNETSGISAKGLARESALFDLWSHYTKP